MVLILELLRELGKGTDINWAPTVCQALCQVFPSVDVLFPIDTGHTHFIPVSYRGH